MKKTIAEKWIKALRSGRYKKTTKVLKRIKNGEKSFCALGVLCDIYQKTHKRKLEEEYHEQDKRIIVLDGEDCDLPEKVVRWAGMQSSVGSLESCFQMPHSSIGELNDSGKSFKQIAEIVKNNTRNL